MSCSVSITAVADIMREVATAEVLPRFRNLSDADIRAKTSSQDLVTLADLEAERALGRRLSDLLPGSVMVGEEGVFADPGILDRINGEAPVWVVDPVDGTGNFARGDATFALIVALVHRGETVAGWILDPVTERLAVAERGGGAMLDAMPVRIDPAPGDLNDLHGTAYGRRGRALKGRVRRLHFLGSAAHGYLRLLDGRFHFAAYSRLMPWDHAAGVLMCSEAGAISRLIDGTPYAPGLRQGELLTAPSEALWNEIAANLQPR
jgi:fructose-1,6-bisphosphatase/inositol monophosphatase family enzyme